MKATKGKAFKVYGVPEMTKTLGSYAKALGPESAGEMRGEIKDILMKPAMVIRDEARDMVPVRTGTLKGAIIAYRGPDDRPGVVVTVNQTEAPYALAVEMGTSNMTAQPFMRPAIAASRGTVANMIADDVEKLLDRIAKENAFEPPDPK